jgi:hypothetical protein
MDKMGPIGTTNTNTDHESTKDGKVETAKDFTTWVN